MRVVRGKVGVSRGLCVGDLGGPRMSYAVLGKAVLSVCLTMPGVWTPIYEGTDSGGSARRRSLRRGRLHKSRSSTPTPSGFYSNRASFDRVLA